MLLCIELWGKQGKYNARIMSHFWNHVHSRRVRTYERFSDDMRDFEGVNIQYAFLHKGWSPEPDASQGSLSTNPSPSQLAWDTVPERWKSEQRRLALWCRYSKHNLNAHPEEYKISGETVVYSMFLNPVIKNALRQKFINMLWVYMKHRYLIRNFKPQWLISKISNGKSM